MLINLNTFLSHSKVLIICYITNVYIFLHSFIFEYELRSISNNNFEKHSNYWRISSIFLRHILKFIFSNLSQTYTKEVLEKIPQIISQCMFENILKDISKVVFRRLHLNSHTGRFIHLNLSKEFCELVTVQTILDEFQFLSDSHFPFDVFHSKELQMSWSYQ